MTAGAEASSTAAPEMMFLNCILMKLKGRKTVSGHWDDELVGLDTKEWSCMVV